MSHIKLLIESGWVNQGSVSDPNWKLMVNQIVTKFDCSGDIMGSFLLTENTDHIRLQNVTKLFNIIKPTRDITLHNFGEYHCSEGHEWQLFMTTDIPHIKDNVIRAKITKGYVFLDDIKPKDTDDDLDMWIYSSLCKLTGPRTIHFNKEI